MVLPGTFGPGVECDFFKAGGFDGPYDCGAEGTFFTPKSTLHIDAYCTIWNDGSCGQDDGHIIGQGTGPESCGYFNPGATLGSFKCHNA